DAAGVCLQSGRRGGSGCGPGCRSGWTRDRSALMPLVLARVDDRLVHGQVVIGWGRPLAATFLVLVDDSVASSQWEMDLYRMAAPDGLEISFATAVQAAAMLPEWFRDPRRGILLAGDLATM